MYYKFLYTVDWKKKKKKKNEWMDDSIVGAIAKSQQFELAAEWAHYPRNNGECRSFENSRTS